MTQKTTIVIIDDHPLFREGLKTIIIRNPGYEVIGEAGSGHEALKMIKKLKPDLVLLDIGLENEVEGGFDLCRQLRSVSTTLPIIFLSARDSDLDTISGLRLGADDYLTKDISLVNLCARIAAFFRRIDALQQPVAEEKELDRAFSQIDGLEPHY